MPKMISIHKFSCFLFLALPFTALSQYTDVINSNRPGLSVSAYAVGKNVVQLETGLFYEQQDHSLLNTQSNILGGDLSVRYGLFFERLELNWEGTFQNEKITYASVGLEGTKTDFYRNRLGLKYLVYDRFKNPENSKPNLYSWRANHVFQLKNLIPSVSVYAGANFNLGDNPYYAGDGTISPRAMIATQSSVSSRMVLISNIAYDRIGTDFPEWSYTLSLSHAFRNPKWSVFVENQGIKSDRYADQLIRSGVAHLIGDNFQADINFGTSFKNTPTRIFITGGFSYRLDFHNDAPKAIEDESAGENGGPIRKNSMKKKKSGRKGSGAEDIDLGPTKKQLKKLRKKEKKKKSGGGEIDF